MNWTYVLVSIGIMAMVTYLPRVLPLAVFRTKITNPFIHSFLAYVPYAVLAAMALPEILWSTAGGGPVTAAVLCGGGLGLLVAVVLALKGKGLLTVALGATAAAFLMEQALRLLGVA